ncbi:DUF6993 domain-containing protein [Phytohabitans sp. LJ34]|uniref:DUF6993 domain-containing protein n=1 Tax=Phytohabitans sp. LJ34 TaxID=3452217 RepID=UPI003F8A2931
MRGRRLWLALGILLLLASGSAVLVPVVRGATGGEDAPPRVVHGFACARAEPDDGYCDRLADDFARREPLSESRREAAGRLVDKVREAYVAGLGAQCPAEPFSCVFAVPPTVEALRAAFVAAGFVEPAVRVARYTDPAPAGAIVYGVRASVGCLVGWVDSTNGATPWIVGTLHDGRCLAA